MTGSAWRPTGLRSDWTASQTTWPVPSLSSSSPTLSSHLSSPADLLLLVSLFEDGWVVGCWLRAMVLRFQLAPFLVPKRNKKWVRNVIRRLEYVHANFFFFTLFSSNTPIRWLYTIRLHSADLNYPDKINKTWNTSFSNWIKFRQKAREHKLLRISSELIWCNFFFDILNQNFTPKMVVWLFLFNQELRWNYFVDWWEIWITRNLLHGPTNF